MISFQWKIQDGLKEVLTRSPSAPIIKSPEIDDPFVRIAVALLISCTP